MAGQFLQPGEVSLIRRDVAQLLAGPDAVAVVMHWTQNVAAPDGVYGDDPTGTPQTVNTRAVVMTVKNTDVRVPRNSDIKPHSFADVLIGDIILMMPKSPSVEGKNGLWFEITGYGEFSPIAQPPAVMGQYTAFFAGVAEQFAQWVYARKRSA